MFAYTSAVMMYNSKQQGVKQERICLFMHAHIASSYKCTVLVCSLLLYICLYWVGYSSSILYNDISAQLIVSYCESSVGKNCTRKKYSGKLGLTPELHSSVEGSFLYITTRILYQLVQIGMLFEIFSFHDLCK